MKISQISSLRQIQSRRTFDDYEQDDRSLRDRFKKQILTQPQNISQSQSFKLPLVKNKMPDSNHQQKGKKIKLNKRSFSEKIDINQRTKIQKSKNNGCGKKDCQICKNRNKSKIKGKTRSLSHKKDAIISQALKNYRRISQKKISHLSQINQQGRFSLLPIKEQKVASPPKKPKIKQIIVEKIQSKPQIKYEPQYIKINGKYYKIEKNSTLSNKYSKNVTQNTDDNHSKKNGSNRRIQQLTSALTSHRNQTKNVLQVQTQTNQADYLQTNHFVQGKLNNSYLKQKQRNYLMEEAKKKRENQQKHQQREFLNEQAKKLMKFKTFFQILDESKMKKQKSIHKQKFEYAKLPLNGSVQLKNSGLDETESVQKQRKSQKLSNSDEKTQKEFEIYHIKFPTVSQINQSINKYQPLTQHVKPEQLKRKKKYIRQYSDEPGKQFLYFGEFNNEFKQKSGIGVLVTKKRILEGIWKYGKLTEGAELKQNGIYRGQFENNVKNGEGVLELTNGEKYQGEWLNGKRDGRGKWQSKNGSVYTGEWKAGLATGIGQLITKNQGFYKGYFVDFIKQGDGRSLLPNGDIYIGEFSDGEPHGFGKYFWKNGLFYEGQFHQKERLGRGFMKFQGIFEIDGEFTNNVPHGICRLRLQNGDEFTGRYLYGERVGYGAYETEKMVKSKPSKLELSYWSQLNN